MSVLCDTNVVSELVRKRPNQGVLRWAETTARIALSVVTIEEITYGLAAKESPRIEKWLEGFLNEYCQVLPVDEATAKLAGNLRGRQRRRGRTHTQADMLIAATAIIHGLTLVTGNTRDFEGCEVSLLDPFER